MNAELMAAAIKPNLVALDVEPPVSKDDLFRGMANCLAAAGRVRDVDEFIAALEQRESLGPTYMGDGLALPHGRSSTVTEPSVAFWRLRTPMNYRSCGDEGEVHRVLMLAVPDGGANDHLRALAILARLLMDEEAVAKLDAATAPQDVIDVVVGFAASQT